ncbi:MAG: hypothetical protein KIT83_01800 [Bryobacterales bacterium]|nr:hypothetical protein [Bryobacterales bacterium]
MHGFKQQQQVVENPETIRASADAPPWVPTLISTSAAVFVVWLVFPILRDEAILRSVGSLFAPLLAVVLAGSVSGVAALLAFRWFYSNMDHHSWLWAIACGANGMLLVPLAYLAEHQSPLAVIWAAFVGCSVARFVRSVPADDPPEPLRHAEGGILFASAAGTEPSLGALFAFGATVAMKAALLTQISGWAIPSALLAGTSCFVIGLLVAVPIHRHDGIHRKRVWQGFVMKGSAAVAVTILLLMQIPVAMPEGPLEAKYSRWGPRSKKVQAQPNLLSGAILLADASTVQRLVAPSPNRKPSLRKRRTASTRIPFTGEYWIRSRSARQRPKDVMEHHASPLGYSFDTVDGSPIHMQAHQKFSAPIDISGARAIEIGIHNLDPQSERIGLKLSIRNTNATPPRWLDLEQLRVPPAERSTMRFPIPPDASIAAFDEVLIEFLLYQPRVNRSAKVAVEWLAFASASNGR